MRVLRNCRDSVILGITAALFVCASADAGDGVPPRPDNAALLYYQACIKAGGVTLPEDFAETLLDGEPSTTTLQVFPVTFGYGFQFDADPV